MEWVVVLGLQGLVGFVFKEILLDLLKGALEDYVKDFFKESIGDLVALFKEESIQKSFGLALKEFLGLFQQALEDADLEPSEIEEYESALSRYLKDSTVLENLGLPFKEHLGQGSCDVDVATLKETWQSLVLQPLPEGFDWFRLVKRYSRKVENILRESDELRKILDSQNLAQIRQQLEAADIAPDFDIGEYPRRLETAFSRLRLDSLDTSGWQYRLQLLRMFVPQPVSRWPDTDEILPIKARTLLGSRGGKYSVILGNPGSGKSTLLQYRALWWAKLSPNKWPLVEFPLLIELRNYIDNVNKNRCSSFLEYLHQGTGVVGGTLNQRRLKEWMETHKTLVMFDGLDEVLEQGDYCQVVEDIINFTHTYSKVRVVVTSRIVGYEPQRFMDAKFRHYLLQDLQKTEITNFLKTWHQLACQEDPKEGERKRARLQESIDTSPTFRELAGNPLLLTMMAILNLKEKLPRDRPTLYERASEVLLQNWDANRGIEDEDLDDRLKALNYEDKQKMLRQVARSMYARPQVLGQTQDRNLLMNRDELLGILAECLQTLGFKEPQIAARQLLNPLTKRSFLLSYMGGNNYGFVHRTFQEYFYAWDIVERFEKHRELSEDNIKENFFVAHWREEAWHEILSLIVGKVAHKFAGEFVECLLQQDGTDYDYRNVTLAAKCLRNVRNPLEIPHAAAKLRRQLDGLSASTQVSKQVCQAAQQAIAANWDEDGSLLVS